MSDVRAAIAGCLDLEGLGGAVLDGLAAAAQVRRYDAGEVILDERARAAGLAGLSQGAATLARRPDGLRAPVAFRGEPGTLFPAGAGALADTAVACWWVAGADLERLRGAHPELARRLDALARRDALAPWIVFRLRHAAVLRHVPPRLLWELLPGSRIVEAPAMAVMYADRPHPDGLSLVLEGEVFLRGRQGTLRLLERGSVYGDLEPMAGRPVLHEVVTGTHGASVLLVPAARFHALVARSATFRRAVLASEYGNADQRAVLLANAFAAHDAPVELVALQGAGAARSTLVGWLARACARDFQDRIAVVRLDPGAPAAPAVSTPKKGERDGIVEVWTRPGADAEALLPPLRKADLVFLDAESASEPWRSWVRRVVHVEPRGWRPPPGSALDRPLLYTAVVPAEGEARHLPVSAARIPRALLEAAHRGVAFEELSADLDAHLARWARAVTDRRIGVALGGGGALAFAHVALLRALHAAGVPVDVVAGCSAGAVVGSWYAADGLDGLEHLLSAAGRFGDTTKRSMFSSRPMTAFIDRELGGRRLEDLVVPFFPVVVDVDRATQEAVRSGTLGEGVRASGAFPGVFGPALLGAGAGGYRRLLDGGLINNVPADTVFLEGASAVVAADIVAPPRPQPWLGPSGPVTRALERLPAPLAAALDELRPIRRYHDVLRGVYLLLQPAAGAESEATVCWRSVATGHTPLDWALGRRIAQAQEDDEEGARRLAAAVAAARVARDALRWRRAARVPPVDPNASRLVVDEVRRMSIAE